MKVKYPSIMILAVLLLPGRLCFAQLSNKNTVVINQFSARLNADLQNDNLHGSISVAVIKNDKVIWAQAFGYLNRDDSTHADTNTIYRIGSITKTFTATLLMQLAAEKKLDLDDPVEKYLPEIKNLRGYQDVEKITLRQLASHTSGLKREPDMPGADVGPLDQWENKLLQCIPNTYFNSRPGQQYLYSNIGYAILGLALSRVSGMPYMQMVQQRIIMPLHMDQTFFALPNDKKAMLAQGIDNDNDRGELNTRLPLKELAGRGYRVPNGGLFSTPADLAKFIMSLTGTPPLLLTAKSRRQMQDIPPGSKHYGLGLMIIHNQDIAAIAHNGSVPGYAAQFAVNQYNGYAVIILRNYNRGATDLDKISLDLLGNLR